jgi:protein-tyrosine phosphatase
MIDLHTHILPAIDDGVETDDQAIEFARMAQADGIRVIVATPHCKEGVWVNDRDRVLTDVAKLRELLEANRVEVELKPGAEVHLCPDLVARVRDGRAPTLDDNHKTLLLELSLTQYPVELANLVFELKLAGLQVLFAHPERIRYFQDDLERYEAVVQLGAFGQITTGSVLGVFGNEALQFSRELLARDLIHVVATDAHNVRGRPPIMSRAIEAISSLVGERRALLMATDAPAALLEGREPELPPAERRTSRRSSFLGRLFRRSM